MKVFKHKQPWDQYLLEFDFTKAFTNSGETAITIVEVVVLDMEDDSDVTADLYDAGESLTEGVKAFVWCQGGVDGARYKWTVRVEGDTYGERYELDAILPVREI